MVENEIGKRNKIEEKRKEERAPHLSYNSYINRAK